MKDLRLINVERKEGYAGIVAGILTIVIGGAMLLAGVYSNAQVGIALDPLNGGTYINATSYCSAGGTWNTTHCVGGTITAVPDSYVPFTNAQNNVFDALEVGGVVVIFVGIGLLIAGVRSLGA